MSRQGSNNGKLSPSFPASIPYALAVGSTFFESGLSGEEQATTQFGSGGGFSYDYTIPSYQADAVKTYLAKSPLIGSKKYASKGRATPDVALLGEKFAVEDGGRVMAVGGTSASTPSWGAVISLLNEECLTASGGQKTLGFVNPLLYKSAHAFNDITKGNNAIGENSGNGWSCTEGWDAATGLGTPNFPKLQAAVKSACGSAASVVVWDRLLQTFVHCVLHCLLTLFLVTPLCHREMKLASLECWCATRKKNRIHQPMLMVVAGAGFSICVELWNISGASPSIFSVHHHGGFYYKW
jgi:hypothetical protein